MADKAINTQGRYLSYLLRLWRDQGDPPRSWRASLEQPHNGVRLSFKNLVALFAFLEKETGSGSTAERRSDKEDHLVSEKGE